MKYLRLAVLGGLLLGGCTNVPDFQMLDPKESDPRVADIIERVRCELVDIKRDHGSKINAARYQAAAKLTLTVDDGAGLSPSFNFIDNFTGGALTGIVGGTLSGARQRKYTQDFSIDFERLVVTPGTGSECDKPSSSARLAGDLGLKGVFETALQSFSKQPVQSEPGVFTLDTDGKVTRYQQKTVVIPELNGLAFGTTVEFTVKRSFGAGPAWKLAHFTGPSGSTGLFSIGRNDSHNLLIAFAPLDIDDESNKPPPKGDAAAVRQVRSTGTLPRAKSLLRDMILQSIVVPGTR